MRLTENRSVGLVAWISNAQGSTVADFHENVTLSCTVSDPKGVKQVTWHRHRTNGSVETVAAYGMHLEDSVLEPFADKVLLTETSLDSTAITVRGVSLEDEGCYICSFNIYPKGTTRKQICLIVRGAAMFTAFPVFLSCELTTPKDVLQVTWQRVTEGRTENMATYSKRYGMKITDPFRDHVHFREAELQECSIAIEGVKKEDESCYKCLFNAFPDGAISGTTCLKVYELHEPMLEVRQTVVQDDGLQVHALSCSVTGRPAPNVSWDARNAILQNSTTTETVHHNGTTTITNHATAVVQSSLPDIEIKVKCVAEDPFKVEKKEIYRRIPIISK
uniref:Ig-like domain-containing protein n=1 Tax=Scleropages formosus TaxID=113540 RepID=A0A8C9RTQ0_SCLFO